MGEERVRRKYDREFKEGAVRLIVEGGRTVRGVARDRIHSLKAVSSTLLSDWDEPQTDSLSPISSFLP